MNNISLDELSQSSEKNITEHLSPLGDNLPAVALNLQRNHPDVFAEILDKMTVIPGITQVEAKETEDNRVILKFQDGGFQDPFLARNVSDGTMQWFAYMVLLHDPKPHPLLCIEEPERHLHYELLGHLADQLRLYAERGGQVFVTTHSPRFLDHIRLEEVYWLEKKDDGFSKAYRAADYDFLHDMLKANDTPGVLWESGFFKSEMVEGNE